MVSDCEGAAGVGAGSGVVTGAGLFTVMVTVASTPLFLARIVYCPADAAVKVAAPPVALQSVPSQLQVVSPLPFCTLAVKFTEAPVVI